MTIPTISTLPVAPARTDAPATFITRADAFLAALVTMQSELNTSIGAMNTDIAGVNADATAAAASASAAATSESNASTSETNAATSETNAASSAAAAASTYDQFDDRYLGSKASDPAVDNDGNALLTGALYFNTTSDDMKVYTGSTWKVTGFNPDSPTFTDTVTAPSFDINSIAATNADTAVDVFVYDTRKDSDGGAWRKRTQNTSWYNETLNTATRGSRKEFPAVAVIVAESNQVAIYDGDDPSLPMWMVFNCNGGSSAMLQSSAIKAVAAKNGILQIASTIYGAPQVKFIEDYGDVYWNASSRRFTNLGISDRNATSFSISNDTTQNLINSNANDIAMTVLPNAPIDAATGLPVPTIAVATDGGVSVIKDDGTVVDITFITGNFIKEIHLTQEYKVLFSLDFSVAAGGRYIKVYDIPTSNLSEGSYTNTNNAIFSYGPGSTPRPFPTQEYNYLNPSDLRDTKDSIYIGYGLGYLIKWYGLTAITKEYNNSASAAYITSNYNTGWLNGDIKLATLSDTDDTNITGSELVTNGDLATGDTTGITEGADSTATVVSGELNVTATAITGRVSRWQISTVIGKTYFFTADIRKTGLAGRVRVTSGATFSSPFTPEPNGLDFIPTDVTTTRSGYFIANATTYYVAVLPDTDGIGITFVDNVSVRLTEADRSVNDNGLQVFGTITKNPVATGADLVAYSGFSSSNYMLQPHNSDLDIDAGDYTCIVWMKKDTLSTYQDIFDFADGSNTNRWEWLVSSSGTLAVFIGGTPTYSATGSFTTGVWNCVAMTRSSGVITHYINGKNAGSGTNSGNIGNANCKLYVGVNYVKGSANGSLSLLRISQTAATAEQIAKIYEDEKYLFQDNAQATLYGSSDAVTALAYDGDTELLHVGTSAGRSVFSGLRRVSNTTAGVTAAISASNGLVAED